MSARNGASRDSQLASWFTKRIIAGTVEVPLRVFRILHEIAGSGKEKCVLEEPYSDAFSAEQSASDVLAHMQGHANAAGGRQVYTVRAYYGFKEVKASGGCWSVPMIGETEEDEDDGASLGQVNENTLLAQSYRHIERRDQTATLMIGELVSKMMNSADRAMESVASMMSTLQASQTAQAAMFDRMVLAQDTKAVRELEVAKALKQDQRIDMAMQALLNYAPIYMADKGSSPATALEMVLDGMRDDQIMEIFRICDPQQQQILTNVIKAKAQRASALKGNAQAFDAKVKEIASSLPVPQIAVAATPEPEKAAEPAKEEPKQTVAAPAVEVVSKAADSVIAMLDDLSEEQVMGIAAILSEEQRQKLLEAMVEREKEKARAAGLPLRLRSCNAGLSNPLRSVRA